MILSLIQNITKTLIISLTGTGEGELIPSNAWLFDDGSPMLWDDNSNILF